MEGNEQGNGKVTGAWASAGDVGELWAHSHKWRAPGGSGHGMRIGELARVLNHVEKMNYGWDPQVRERGRLEIGFF